MVKFYSVQVDTARARFPRGLEQPAGGFRFSADALLLAAWLTPAGDARRLLDLGTGCGAAAFALLLAHPGLSALGVDVQEAALQAARRNAVLLGLEGRFRAKRADLAGEEPAVPARRFDIVVANPPYRLPDRGRLPASGPRQTALFDPGGLADAFCRTAARSLRPWGRFGLIFGADRQEDFMESLARAGLAALRLRTVHSRAGAPARFVLLEAGLEPGGPLSKLPAFAEGAPPRGAAPADGGLLLEPPLALHEGEGGGTRLTAEALAFCPYLA